MFLRRVVDRQGWSVNNKGALHSKDVTVITGVKHQILLYSLAIYSTKRVGLARNS